MNFPPSVHDYQRKIPTVKVTHVDYPDDVVLIDKSTYEADKTSYELVEPEVARRQVDEDGADNDNAGSGEKDAKPSRPASRRSSTNK